MTAPTLKIDEAALRASSDVPASLRAIAARIIAALRQPPYHVRLQGLAPTEDRSLSVALAKIIATTAPIPNGISREKLLKVSFTKVQIDPERAATSAGSTAYSRTNQPLAMHTDSSYLGQPHALVAFQMVRADPGGGETTMTAVDDVLAAMPKDIAPALTKPIFPFGRGDFPILFRQQNSIHIRYYRDQINNAVESGAELSSEAADAMAILDEVLAEKTRKDRFRIEAGETLFMHNTKVLHGRTGFEGQSSRLLYRLRMHCGCLG